MLASERICVIYPQYFDKLFTIVACFLGLAILPVAAASVRGSGVRFFLETILVARGGPAVTPVIERNMERAGETMVILLVGLAGFFYLRT